MLNRKFLLTAITLLLSSSCAFAANPPATPVPQQVYGQQLMSAQERAEHRTRMWSATTVEEKALVRAETHARMQERAEQQGLSLPDAPPAAGYGRRSGGGMGPGGGRGR